MNSDIATRFASIDAWRRADRARHADWLTAGEQAELVHWRDRGRRAAWLAGRWIAKSLLVEAGAVSAADLRGVEILSLDDQRRPVRPLVRTNQGVWPGSISIAHTGDAVMAVTCRSPTVRVGCDLHDDRRLGPTFVELWFSAAERRWVSDGNDPDDASMIWIAKEAFYKAVNRSEPFAPRQFEIRRVDDRWRCLYRGVEVDGSCTIRRLCIDGRNYLVSQADAVPDETPGAVAASHGTQPPREDELKTNSGMELQHD